MHRSTSAHNSDRRARAATVIATMPSSSRTSVRQLQHGNSAVNGGGSSQSVRPRSQTTAQVQQHDEASVMVDDEPVNEFINTVTQLPPDEWRARTLAFETLVESVPLPSQHSRSNTAASSVTENHDESGATPWYKSATTLRRLATPALSSLLLDPRSTVVKHTCQYITLLVQRTASTAPHCQDACKHLLKDLLPTILALHAQTVNVIRGYALTMMSAVIPLCRFKSALPIFLEKLRKDKSRDVREACARYLRMILTAWTPSSTSPSSHHPQSHLNGSGSIASCSTTNTTNHYLTNDIATHIGNGIARALMDPSQCVRMEARSAFETYRTVYPQLWSDIVHKPDGILSKDVRIKKSVINAAVRSDAEKSLGQDDASVIATTTDDNGTRFASDADDGASVQSAASRGSINSRASSTALSRISIASRNSYMKHGRNGSGLGSGGLLSINTRPGVAGVGIFNRSSFVSDGGSTSGGGIIAAGMKGPPLRLLKPPGSALDVGNSSSTGLPRPSLRSAMLYGSPDHMRTKARTLSADATSSMSLSRTETLAASKREEFATGLNSASSSFEGTYPFASAMISPQGKAPSMNDHKSSSDQGLKVNEVLHRAATSIQGAFRGYSIRYKMLQSSEISQIYHHQASQQLQSIESSVTPLRSTSSTRRATPTSASRPPLRYKSPPFRNSPDVQLLQSARKSILGMTAARMAHRRKTVSADETKQVHPIPPSPGGMSIGSVDSRGGADEAGTVGDGGNLLLRTPIQIRPHTLDSFREDESKNSSEGIRNISFGENLQNADDELLRSKFEESSHSKTRSHMLQQRFERQSSSQKSCSVDAVLERQQNVDLSLLPRPLSEDNSPSDLEIYREHVDVANQLLVAHKEYIDGLMETLRLEMDVIRDFESLLESSSQDSPNVHGAINSSNGTQQVRHPTEDEVLDYFESVALFLEKRSETGDKLRRTIDRISRGDVEEHVVKENGDGDEYQYTSRHESPSEI